MLNTSASVFVPATAAPTLADRLYNASHAAKLELSSETNEKFVTKYKTELCKNWIEVGYCRYKNKCKFAHGQDEIVPVKD